MYLIKEKDRQLLRGLSSQKPRAIKGLLSALDQHQRPVFRDMLHHSEHGHLSTWASGDIRLIHGQIVYGEALDHQCVEAGHWDY
jgi:hypothetical protein